MTYLYRGVSKKLDLKNKGKLLPNGTEHEVVALFNDKIKYDGKFTFGKTEDNAVRAQQIETGLYGSCFVSTSKSEKIAVKYATTNFTEDGFVYILDPSIFQKYGVILKEFSDSRVLEDEEVSIRTIDNGIIPKQVIIGKYEINKSGKIKV